jgi:dTMP kinase
MFIVFEGIDGCGKTTQIWKLAKYLSDLNKYNHLVLTREPYKAREIREILRLDEDPEKKAERLTELFVKDRQEHIDEIIKPALEKNLIVLSDRYKYSTLSYQLAQGQDIEKLKELHKNMLIPDLVFIFDVSIENTIKRMMNDKVREAEHKFEKNKDFLQKVKMNYLKMKEVFPDEKIIILDANKTIDEIFEDIIKHLENINI